MTDPSGSRAPARWTFTILMLGNIVIGAGVLSPAALLNVMTRELGVSTTQIGALMGWGAAALCIGAPTLAWLAARIDRRSLLVGSLALYCVGHAASAFASDYGTLLALRVVMILGAAIYTPQAASAVAMMAAPERRAGAVAFVFMGWPIAGAVASPLMAMGGEAFGWSAVYLALAAAAGLGALAVALRTPARLTPPPVSLGDWGRTLTTPAILTLLITTTLQVTGQFTLFPYFAAELRREAGADASGVALGLGLYGASGLLGSALATRLVGGVGAARMQLICLGVMAVGLAAWAAGAHLFGPALAAAFVWGLGFAAAVSMQQARLIAIAPDLSSASVALNTSFLYLGQALGAALGGAMIEAGSADWLGAAGCALMAAAMAASFLAQRRFGA